MLMSVDNHSTVKYLGACFIGTKEAPDLRTVRLFNSSTIRKS